MMQMLMNRPADLAIALASDLVRRNQSIDIDEIDHVYAALEQSVATAVYATKAKALLAQPLRQRKIDVDGSDWKQCGIKLYSLWQSIRPAEVERRMAALAQAGEGRWEEVFPDPWTIDEATLTAFYKAGQPLEVNGIHAWSDASLALRYYVAEQLAPVSAGRGTFDWGASDGISSIFLRHHGARGVTVIEPIAAPRAFGGWLSKQLGLTDIEFHEDRPLDPAGQTRRYGAGICTEVLEHVVDPVKMIGQMHDMLLPGGVVFITSSFGVPQDTHLKQNLKYAGRETELMEAAGLVAWTPRAKSPIPFFPQWGFWQRRG